MSLANRSGSVILGLALCLCWGTTAAQVVAVVSSKSPVTALSKNQVADIFLGRASRFPDGGPAVPIDQAEGSVARDEFYEKIAGKSAPQVKAHWAKIIFTGRGRPPEQVSNGVEMKKAITKNPRAIGYIESDQVDANVRVLVVD